MTDPALMCRKHLLGEHVEMHMFVGVLNRGTSVDGYMLDGLLDLGKLHARHDIVVAEMLARGMNHNSPLGYFKESLALLSPNPHMNDHSAMMELVRRCVGCRRLHEAALGNEQFKDIPLGGDGIVKSTTNGVVDGYHVIFNGELLFTELYPKRATAVKQLEDMRKMFNKHVKGNTNLNAARTYHS